MAESTDMYEKCVMMEQTIMALKKSVDEKNVHIAQLMNKLEAFTHGESSHVPLVNLVLINETRTSKNL